MSSWFRKLQRPMEGRLLFGVCAGLAHAARLDAMLVRLAFTLLALASGVGLLLYVLVWLLTPVEADSRTAFGQVLRRNLQGLPDELRHLAERTSVLWARREEAASPDAPSRRWAGLTLVGGGVLLLLYSLGLFSWLGPLQLIGLAVIAIGASLLLNMTPNWRR
jgi:phage shock protein PspC (stress-responsive transcriptional regulator)